MHRFYTVFMTMAILAQWIDGNATTFISRPFEEVVSDAPIIVRGTIGESRGEWIPAADGSKRIHTLTELKVKEVFKGKVPSTNITFKEIGGTVGGTSMEISGRAVFNPSEDVVLTLAEKDSNGIYQLVGMSSGRFDINRDEKGQEVLVGMGTGGGHDSHGHHDLNGAEPDNSTGESHWSIDRLRVFTAKFNAPSQPERAPKPQASSLVKQAESPAQHGFKQGRILETLPKINEADALVEGSGYSAITWALSGLLCLGVIGLLYWLLK
jgi:hypothetical protein